MITNWEGFPLSILESMRAGLPVVASSVGGVSESVRDGENGYLVERGDVGAVSDRIRRLLQDAGLRARMGRAGRARYERDFTLGQSVSRTLDVYRRVIEATAPSDRRHSRGSDAGIVR